LPDRLLSSTEMHNRRLARHRFADRLLSSTGMRNRPTTRRLLVDGTPVEADVALKSLRAELSVASCDADSAEGPDAAEGTSPPALCAGPAAVGADPKRVASNATRCRGLIRDTRLRHESGIASTWCIADRSRSIPSTG
jgi:hypothetical protein